jgi:hypothetical protein
MSHPRRSYTQAEELALTTQVEGYCPLCGESLFYVKRAKSHKGYDLAHIYPLNPKPEEVTELGSVILLNANVNHPDNIIPLCTDCHTRFDKPRTREEYEHLAAVKRELVERARQREIMNDFPLDEDIRRIISRLHDINIGDSDSSDLALEAKSLDDKFDDSLPKPTRQKIRHAVTDYYQHVRREFRELELQTPAASQLIYSQVRAFYLKHKRLGLPQSAIFRNVVEWVERTTSPSTREAAEIVASFFVQNCEVFE